MPSGTILRLALAAVLGTVVGALTLWSVLRVPHELVPLTNAASPWILVAFAVALSGRRLRESVTLAVLAFLALIVGFYAAEHLRGWSVDRHKIIFWAAATVVAGPLVGVTAGALRTRGAAVGALGAGTLGGLLIGEAAHGLTALRFSSPAGFWDAQIALGAAIALGAPAWRSRERVRSAGPAVAMSTATCALAGSITFVAFGLQ